MTIRRARGQGARNPHRKENIDARRRSNLALRLFLSGQRSYQAIADTPDPERGGQPLYKDRSAAFRAVERAIARIAQDRETVNAVDVTLSELDMLQRSLMPTALNPKDPGRFDALAQLRWIFDHRAKVRGDYAPARGVVEVITNDMVDQEIKRLTEELAAGDLQAAGLLDDDDAALDAVGEM